METAILIDRSELALLGTALEALYKVTPIFWESRVIERMEALNRTLHVRAGAAGPSQEALFPLVEEELPVIEQARDDLRRHAYGRSPAVRPVREITALLHRLYERVGAARVMHMNDIEMIAPPAE